MFIKFNEVTKCYLSGSTSVRALYNVSLNIKKGEFLAIAGPSGSGKTTLLNLLAGLDYPTEGRIYVDEKDITKMGDGELSRYRRTYIGFVFQRFYLIPHLTALENVIFPKMFDRKMKEKNLKMLGLKIMEYVNIAHKSDRYPTELSGGEAQRVAIARALINNPKIILADEPTGELDTENSDKIISLFKKLNHNDNITVIIASHDPRVWQKSQRVVRLEDGEIRGNQNE